MSYDTFPQGFIDMMEGAEYWIEGPSGERVEVPDIATSWPLIAGIALILAPALFVAVDKAVKWDDKRQWERERRERHASIGRDAQEFRMKKFRGEI